MEPHNKTQAQLALRLKEKEEQVEPPKIRWPISDGLKWSVVRQSVVEGRGLGVYATKDIMQGIVVLVEAPLMISSEIGARADAIQTAFDALHPLQQARFRTLHAYRPEERRMIDSRFRSIVYTNSFAVGYGYCTSAVFYLGSRFNHSCVPNTTYIWTDGENNCSRIDRVTNWRPEGDRMVFMTCRKVPKNEELTIDYGHTVPQLKKLYGFDCNCGGCRRVPEKLAREVPLKDYDAIAEMEEERRADFLRREARGDYAMDAPRTRRRTL